VKSAKEGHDKFITHDKNPVHYRTVGFKRILGYKQGKFIKGTSYAVFLYISRDMVGALTGLKPARVCWESRDWG